MSENSVKDQKVSSSYPYFTVLAAAGLVGFFYCVYFLGVSAWQGLDLSSVMAMYAVFGVFILAVLFDCYRAHRVKKVNQRRVQSLTVKIDSLLERKKDLQSKNHIYAGHADKLKMFISDKLLEHIEYDEKYLHFKNIASEVRHNGIISYDKIRTYLDAQWQVSKSRSLSEVKEIEQAADSLQYLWDLLDLSTADNIALHIANQVCDSEERLFEQEMFQSKRADDKSSIESVDSWEDLDHHNSANNVSPSSGFLPVKSFDQPIYASDSALLKALARCFGEHAEESSFSTWRIPNHDNLWVRINTTSQLLGNENHAILILENIISNAQYYSGRSKGNKKDKNARIAIELNELENDVCYRIYNKGPHIDTKLVDKLFSLGFSTRRARANHGRGLGLYFAHEISKGYDGRLSFKNVSNVSDVISLRVELENGEVFTEVIDLVSDHDSDNKNAKAGALCRSSDSQSSSGEALSPELTWSLSSSVESIEVTHQSDQHTHRYHGERLQHMLNDEKRINDPSHPLAPQWTLRFESNDNGVGPALVFQVEEVDGVQFELRLPTLRARIDGDVLTPDEEQLAQEVDDLSAQFSSADA